MRLKSERSYFPKELDSCERSEVGIESSNLNLLERVEKVGEVEKGKRGKEKGRVLFGMEKEGERGEIELGLDREKGTKGVKE